MLALAGPAITATAQTQASSCQKFIDSIGVNTHFANDLDSSDIWYSGNFSQLTAVLKGLGVKHIRDGMIPAYANNPSSGQSTELHALATYGIYTDLIFDPGQGTVASQEAALKVLNTGTAVVEAVEGPNEADQNSSFSYNGEGFPAGDAAFQSDLYTAVKGDPATSGLTVIGPSEGGTYSAAYPTPPSQGGQPFSNGELYPTCDWGNCHPYTFGGNFASQVFSYETINSYFRQGQFPGCNIGVFPYTFTEYQPPFALYNAQGVQTTSRPMAATEKGYFNGSATESVSATTYAKYIPRIFAEDFAKGFVRTYSYELMDEGTDLTNNQDNFGLVAHNFAPKPAYYALQNMISLLSDSGGTFTPSSLTYSVTVTPPAGYTQSSEVPDYYFNPATQAVDNVLLQKSNGTFELLIWNDISSSAFADTSGNTLAGTARDLSPPAFPAVIALPASIVTATIHSLNPDGTVSTSAGNIANNKLSVNVPDNVLIIDLNTLTPVTTDTPTMPTWALILTGFLLLLAGTYRGFAVVGRADNVS